MSEAAHILEPQMQHAAGYRMIRHDFCGTGIHAYTSTYWNIGNSLGGSVRQRRSRVGKRIAGRALRAIIGHEV